MALELACAPEGLEGLAIDAEEMARVLSLVLDQEGVGRPCVVSVSVTDDEGMRALNAEWRGVDAATDVISLECERPDDPSLLPDEPCELGDIVLDPAYIDAQASRFGTTPQDETRLLAIHGLLHLLGYDHLEEDEARVMEAREDELLALACGRPVAPVATTRHRGEGEK
ncbi:rRNA maturation RNase YbeY [Atopobiaceae bacterium 24-176]